jgi:hypothetical protein
MAASLEVSSSNELLVRQSPAGKDVKTEAEERRWKTLPGGQPVKIQQTVKTSYVL